MMHFLKKSNCLKTTKSEKNNNNMRKNANSMQKIILVKICGKYYAIWWA